MNPQTPRDEVRLRSAGALWYAAFCAACSTVTPGADAGPALNKDPGKPFRENVCFICALRACGGSVNACAQEATCAAWLNCVADCPTDDSGVAAEGDALRKCGLPVSAQVLYGCVEDFSSGFLLGCEEPCTPL